MLDNSVKLHNILSTTDGSDRSQMDSLNDVQKEGLKRIIFYISDYDDWMDAEDKKFFFLITWKKLK
jgi:hypothetical protein